MKQNSCDVAIASCQSYVSQALDEALSQLVSACPLPDLAGKSVLLKPNILSDASPEDCITTNPEFLRAVIRLAKQAGAREILVGDSPGMQGNAFKPVKCGIWDVCQEEGVTWVDFTKNSTVRRIPGTRQKLPIADAALSCDVLISVCKFKTHQLMYATGAVKNLFGLVPGLHKSPCHVKNPTRESFARLVCGINELAKPAYCIMDAVIGMEGPGPANGTPRAVNLILASKSCAALDWAQAVIMGYNPAVLPMIRETKRRGMLPQVITYPLLKAEDLAISDFKRIQYRKKTKFVSTLLLPYFTRKAQKRKQKTEPAPQFDDQKCIRCLRCVRICPAKALELKDSKVVADYSKCIRCYCCHEMCPADAIEIKGKKQC